MQRARGGYTIIEVLVVLAVGLIIFFAAVTLFAGKQGKTQFSQAMRDVESQILSIANDVGVSTFPEASNYTCDIAGGSQRPRLTPVPSGTGTNTECIFLGKAIEIITDSNPNNSDELRTHTVLGRRTNGTVVVTNFDDANPTAAEELNETYKIPFVAKVRSAHEDVLPNSDTYLMGFYNSLQSAGAGIVGGSQSIKTIGYVGPDSYGPGLVKTTIEDIFSPASSENSKVWKICFQSGTSNEFAQLLVNSTSAGVTTEVKYTTGCS